MQGNNQGSGTSNNNGQKPGGSNSPNQSGLSWTTPARPSSSMPAASTQSAQSTPAAKPATPVTPPAQPKSTARPTHSSNTSGNTNKSSRTFAYFAGGIVLAAIILWALFGMQRTGSNTGAVSTSTSKTATSTAKSTPATNSPAATITNITSSQSSQFLVSNQKAGTQVTATSVRVPNIAWLVVYESVNGAPGNALGAAMAFPENNGKNVVIPLLRGTIAGRSYLVGESIDNGDRIFSLQSDTKVVDSKGAMFVSTFNAN